MPESLFAPIKRGLFKPMLRPLMRPDLGGTSLASQVAALFAAGEQGAWYDPSDMATMWQDSVGTVPVTAAGQPVGLILDKSGRGNHMSQATTTNRMLLQQDGAGLYYLERDGVDDYISTAAVFGLDSPWSIAWSGQYTQTAIATSARGVVSLGGSGTNYFEVGGRSDAQQTVGARVRNAAIGSALTAANGAALTFPAGVNAVEVGTFDAAEISVQLNNTPIVAAVLPASPIGGPLNLTLGIGAAAGPAPVMAPAAPGRVYQIIALRRATVLTPAERITVKTFLAQKAGVTL